MKARIKAILRRSKRPADEKAQTKTVEIAGLRMDCDSRRVYVNGKEAGRYNMPNGNITFNSFSSSYAGDTPLTGTMELSSSLFKSGDNTIAVEIHNNSYTSSDQFWDAELLTTICLR